MLGIYNLLWNCFTSIPWWIMFILAPIITGFIGLLLEKLAYKPLRESPRIILISAIELHFSYKILG